jgi:hypothetical protein
MDSGLVGALAVEDRITPVVPVREKPPLASVVALNERFRNETIAPEIDAPEALFFTVPERFTWVCENETEIAIKTGTQILVTIPTPSG